MRNAQKQVVLDCMESMHQAHEEIRNALREGSCSLTRNMLSQCQEFAVSLGEYIESLEGEGHVTVACLEEYCEALYHIYEELDSGGASAGKVYKKLQKQLLKVENSVKRDIRVRREIVFLPYKASMWDSLESVWKAADEDPDCDAYVIPIPYYDRKPDGSFGERHYEAGLYPENVPVVYYGNYDFEKRRPDIVFIHNPYDNYNFVTSVEPFFYSDNLKKFTDKLIYIPYFVLGEPDLESKESLEGMKHFCVVPGVFHADRVIVQSENMRQAYISVLTEDALSNMADGNEKEIRRYWEEKILGLGSPKFDKVLNTRKEDLEIPEEWKRIIEKPDGSWKKIIFYNTSVSALLRHRQDMINKIQYILQYFEKHTDNVVLLWRPHPLYENTISSMLPFLLPQYRKLVNIYREKEYGIYDESGDLHRAIALADAYYGDGSSVAQMFKEVGKPIMIQAGEARNFCRQNCFYGKNIINERNEMWLPTAYCSTLLHIDRVKGEITCVGEISGQNKIDQYMYTDIVKCGNTFYFAPTSAERIAKYCPEEGFSYIEFSMEYKCEFYKNSLEAFFVESSQCLYLVGARRSNMVIKIDKGNERIEKLKEIQFASGEELGQSAVIANEILYITVVSEEAKLYKYDLKNDIVELKRLSHNGAYTVTINHWGGVFYISLSNGNIIVWDGQKIVKEIITENTGCFISSIVWKDKLWLFPRKEKERVYSVSLYNLKIENSFKINHIVSSVHSDKDQLLLNTNKGIFEMSFEGDIKEVQLDYEQGKDAMTIVSEWNPGWEFELYRHEGNPEYNTVNNFVEYIIENEERYGEVVKYGCSKFKNKNIGENVKQIISQN